MVCSFLFCCCLLENKHECEEYDFTSTASPDEDNEEELGKRKKKQKLFQDCVIGNNLKHGEPVTMIILTLNRKLLTYIQVFTSVYSLFIHVVVSLAILVKFNIF